MKPGLKARALNHLGETWWGGKPDKAQTQQWLLAVGVVFLKNFYSGKMDITFAISPFLSVQFSGVKCNHIVCNCDHHPPLGPFPSCKTGTLYPVHSSSPFPSCCPGNLLLLSTCESGYPKAPRVRGIVQYLSSVTAYFTQHNNAFGVIRVRIPGFFRLTNIPLKGYIQ